uniref:SS18 N-terminal domain-containing protein n=1 Tax=Castor canadensis TaxID=51338 RepID=A0A8C0ZM97_CASCN
MSPIPQETGPRDKGEVNQETIQRLLVENNRLIRCFLEHQNKGPANECIQYQPAWEKSKILSLK